MKLYTFQAGGRRRAGIECGGRLVDVQTAYAALVSTRGLPEANAPPALPPDPALLLRMGPPGYKALRQVHAFITRRPAFPVGAEVTFAFEEVQILPPISKPGKIICCKINRCGSAPTNTPVFTGCFLKPSSSLLGTGRIISRPAGFGDLRMDPQLALIVGNRIRYATPDEALKAVAGATLLADLFLAAPPPGLLVASLARQFDSFCPCGPALLLFEPEQSRLGWNLEVRVGTGIVFKSEWPDWEQSCAPALAQLSEAMTIEPGDIVSFDFPKTSPGGIELPPGVTLTLDEANIGALVNPVQILLA